MEALTSREDSENRITIGGKRKSSSRRSSILKATKSPLKAGVLEDLDPNSLDDNGRNTSKKSRRSSGRRVSFAEKNDIKEFFVEDWKNSWPKDQENSDLLELSTSSQGEYREPANSIEGLESLLKGNIQAPDDFSVCQVEIEEIPEPVTLKPSEQAEEMEYTTCYSSVLQNSATNMENTKIFSHDTAIDLDITCSQKKIFYQDGLNNQVMSPAGFQENDRMDSTSFLLSLGSKHAHTQGIKVKHDTAISATRSNDSISRRRQPIGEIRPEQGGYDSQSGSQQSPCSNADVELTACHSFAVLESNSQKTKRRSVYEPAELELTSCYGQGLAKSSDNQEVGVQKRQALGVRADLNAFRNSFETNLPDKAQPVCETQLNITNCSRDSMTSGKKTLLSFDNQTNVEEVHDDVTTKDSTNDFSFDSTVFLRSLGARKSPIASVDTDNRNLERNQNENQSPGSTGHLEMTRCYGTGILQNTRLPVLITGSNHTLVFSSDTDRTDSLDLTVCQTQKQQAASAPFPPLLQQNSQNEQNSPNRSSSKMNSSVFLRGLGEVMPSVGDTNEEECDLELTTCHSQPVLENSAQNTSRSSVTELSDLDVTSCHGPGLLQSVDNCDRLDANKRKANQLCQSADVAVTVCHGPGLLKASGEKVEEKESENQLSVDSASQEVKGRSPFEAANYMTSHSSPELLKSSGKNFDESVRFDQSGGDRSHQMINRKSLYEPVDVDVTSCYGAGLLKTSDEKLEGVTPRDQSIVDNSSRKISRKGVYEPADVDVTSCYGAGLLKATDEKLDAIAPYIQAVEDSCSRKRSRRSIYEPADVDVTLCFGAGLLKTTGERVDTLAPYNQPVVGKSCQKTDRRSIYEPEDIDITSCYDAGRLKSNSEKLDAEASENQQVADNSLQRNKRKSIYEPTDIDVTSCFGQGVVQSSSATVSYNQLLVGSSSHGIKQRSHYEPVDVDMTSCYDSGMLKNSGEILRGNFCESKPAQGTSALQQKRRSLYEPTDVDVTSCHGSGMVIACKGTSEIAQLQHQSAPDMDGPKLNRRSFHEPLDIDSTSCYDQGKALASEEDLEVSFFHQQPLLNNTLHKSNRRGIHETKDMDIISCYDPGMAQSPDGNVETIVCQPVLDDSMQMTNQQNLHKTGDVNVTRCQDSGPVHTLDSQGVHLTVSKEQLDPARSPQNTFTGDKDIADAVVEKERDLNRSKGETSQTSRVSPIPKAFLETDADDSLNINEESALSSQQMALKANCGVSDSTPDRKLSVICEESLSELSKKGMSVEEDADVTEMEKMQHSRSAITLKEFLDIIEIAFITEVNMRRSVVPSAVVEAPQTLKDRMISTLVSKPKAVCYEEAIPIVESEITAMKGKVEQQEMELNVSNPRIFMEVQTASKEELLALQSKVRRLRSVCEKTSKREWKENKGQLNKKVLLKMTTNHAALAKDVLVVEESVNMVDDCLSLLDKMNRDFDEKMKNIHMSLTESEKEIQRQTNMVEELATMSEALRKSEQELADLESTRSKLQSEKHELAKNKDQLDGKILETEETIRLVKRKDPRSNKPIRELSQKLDILVSLQEWSLEEWNKERAKFAFLNNTLEIVVVFAPETTEGVFHHQDVRSVKLNFTTADTFTGRMGKVQTIVKKLVNEDILNQMYSSRKDLAKVLEHVSGIIHKSNEIGDELFRIGLSHLMSFEEDRLIVEFSSLKAFVKFVLHIQVGLSSYPNCVSLTALPKIGHLSQTEIEETLNAVSAGPRYLSRVVDVADQLLSTIKPATSS